MNRGVPQKQESLSRDSLAVSRRPVLRIADKTFRLGLILLGLLSIFTFASSALGVNAIVGLGSAASLLVLDDSTITNTDYHA
jgi:hypothetical protein